MTIKRKLAFYLHRTTIVLLCFVLVAILMVGSAHFIYRQQVNLSEQKVELTHQLIKQISLSLAPLIEKMSGNDDGTPTVTLILEGLIQQPWIVDASVYQLDGQLVAQVTHDVSVRQRLRLDDSSLDNTTTQQVVEEIISRNEVVGFIRVTLDLTTLKSNLEQLKHTIIMVWTMLLLTGVVGFILAKAMQMKAPPRKGQQAGQAPNSAHGHKKKKSIKVKELNQDKHHNLNATHQPNMELTNE